MKIDEQLNAAALAPALKKFWALSGSKIDLIFKESHHATGEQRFADQAAKLTLERMASHVSHVGVHDHGFNNLSTYGNWLRLQREGKLPANQVEFCEVALKTSGAVQ